MTAAHARGNLARFSGFADLYDAVRPSPPAELGALLCRYAGTDRPAVVDLGSGSGLSSRWAATWAGSVVGVEPNDDMRAVAESRPAPGVRYRKGLSDATGLPDASADVVLVVQALHWMDPDPTLAEVARVLRRGGVLAAADCDWPPVVGSSRAEQAWTDTERRFDVLEQRLLEGEEGERLHRPVDPADGIADADGSRDLLGDARRWGKGGHLCRMAASGRFAFTREVALFERAAGGADRFVELLRSQGTYQNLAGRGLSDEVLGMDRFAAEVRAAFASDGVAPVLGFTWRVRLGSTPGGA